MKKQDIQNFINPDYLEEILGNFSKATGLRIEAVNYKGETYSIPGKLDRSAFCQYIRKSPQGSKRCIDSYKRASAEAVKWDEPYFFRCHAGLVIWTIPIVHKGASLGSIICGQVLHENPGRFFLRQLANNNSDLDLDELAQTFAQLSVISPQQAQSAASLLNVVVSHLLKKNLHALEEEKAYRVLQQELRSEITQRKKELVELSYDVYLKNERRFLQYIRLGDKSRSQVTLKSLIIQIYTKAGGDKRLIKARILDLASLTSRAAVEGGVDADQAIQTLNAFNQKIEQIERLEEYLHGLQEIVDNFLEGIFIMADKKHLSLVKNARTYILQNYASPLTIKDVADALFISPSYLSRLFRKELNCTFNDYLTRVRVEKAVELMKKPELSVEQVSKAVGYLCQSYFARIFRKYIGVTPLTYKNSLF